MAERLTLARAFTESWRAWRHWLAKCRAHATPEAVHQLRVTSRRLAALLDLLGRVAPSLRKERDRLASVVDAVLHHLSSLRDAQVQQHRVLVAAERQPGLDALALHLGRRETHRRRRVRRALRKLRLGRVRKAASRLRREMKRAPEPSPAAVRRVVDARFAAVRRRMARLQPEKPDSFHRLRIAVKQFRYAAEIAASLSPLRLRHRPAIRALQDQMGEAHDTELLIERVTKFSSLSRFSDAAGEGATGDGSAALVRALERERDRRVERVAAATSAVDNWWPPPAVAVRNRVTGPGQPGGRDSPARARAHQAGSGTSSTPRRQP